MKTRPSVRPVRGARALLAVLSVGAASGCLTPFSDFQSARTVAPGEAEITASYSYVRFTSDGESEKVQDEFGLQAAFGIGDRTELRTRYHLVKVGDDYVNVLAVGPKLGVSPGTFAVYAPLGMGFGSGIESTETLSIQPTMLFTHAVSSSAEVTGSVKAHVWLNSDADNLLAFNLGVGLGPDVRRWAIRPEVGVLINPGEDGAAWQFGIGLSRGVGGSR